MKRGGTTFHTYIFAAAGGEHCIFANTGDAVTKLEASELPSDVLDGVDVLYTDFFVPKAGLSCFINFDCFSDILTWYRNSIALYRYGVLHFWGISFFYSRRSRNRYKVRCIKKREFRQWVFR